MNAAPPAPAPPPPNVIPPKYQTERKLLIAGIVVAVAVAVVALIFYLKSSGSGDSGRSASSAQSDIPTAIANNLKRSRRAANQAAAAATVRTLVTAELTFSMTFPKAGYASSLFQLGPGAETCVPPHPDAANGCMLDFVLGCSAGASGTFCVKDTYKYAITPVGAAPPIPDFVILATPADRDAGETDYCATSDGVVRFRANPDPPSRPLATVAECTAWIPL
ncbi:MAG TPA: hypothetical protein VI636_14420 [Candidatus Angelobacter sp.]